MCVLTGVFFVANILFEGDDEAFSVPSIILDAIKKVLMRANDKSGEVKEGRGRGGVRKERGE